MARGAALLGIALLLLGAASTARAEGEVSGRVTFELPGMRLADLGPIVVYVAAQKTQPAPPSEVPSLHQKSARFAPAFLAIAAGQSVDMPNDDEIFHNVFSYSRPNAFDLGLYPAGEKRTVRFAHPGLVKLYCSIHESMNGLIFVSPSPWFATVRADGSFVLRGVPSGPRVVRTWNEKLPDSERTVEVPASGEVTVEIPLVP